MIQAIIQRDSARAYNPIDCAERERQRIAHLVLGQPRPAPTIPKKPAGISKQEWKASKAALREAGRKLAPGIEEAVAVREVWAGKQGTPETLEHAETVRTRQGALARLYATGVIDVHQLEAAAEIAGVYEQICRGVSVRAADYGTRVDSSRHGDGFYEALGAVRREMAYTRWRATAGRFGPMAAIMDMIIGDVGVTIAAQRHRMHVRRAKRILIDALDHWQAMKAEAARQIDPATLAAAHAGILA